MKKYTEKEIQEICKENNVSFHHFDQFNKPRYKNHRIEDLKDAVVVIYSSQYSHWVLGINIDGSITYPYKKCIEKLQELKKSIAWNI